jgi:hypothetical protein
MKRPKIDWEHEQKAARIRANGHVAVSTIINTSTTKSATLRWLDECAHRKIPAAGGGRPLVRTRRVRGATTTNQALVKCRDCGNMFLGADLPEHLPRCPRSRSSLQG